MPLTTTPSERIGLCTRMRRFLVRFIRPESFVHTRSSAGFTITTSGFEFSVHTGVHGYIPKSQSDAEIITATSDVLSGRIYVPAMIAEFKSDTATGNCVPLFAETAEPQIAELQRLTARQRDVLILIAEGRSNKEIARALGIAEPTTKIHVAALMRIL